MAAPMCELWTLARHVLSNRWRGNKRYPVILTLEPVIANNLSCGDGGNIRYPDHVLRRRLTAEQCLAADEDVGAPIVSIAGGEPLLHPEIDRVVSSLIERKKFVRLHTNALLLEDKLPLFRPSTYLSVFVHLDGTRHADDSSIAVRATRAAIKRGFRVTTLSEFPMLVQPKRRECFHQLPLLIQRLMGVTDLGSAPWGSPTYNIFGWQRPCFANQDGYARTYRELMESTHWEELGTPQRNHNGAHSMGPSGIEPTVVKAQAAPLDGVAAEQCDAAARRRAIDAAFDYTGDVTLTLASGYVVAGYLFHRDWTRGDGVVEIFPSDGGKAIRLLAVDIVRIAFGPGEPASVPIPAIGKAA